MAAARTMPLSMCTSFAEGGYTALHEELERCVADFVGKEAAIVFNMGFATNALGIPALGGKGTLLVSDSLNHSSIVVGARASGAVIRVYQHNDYKGLESLVSGPVGVGIYLPSASHNACVCAYASWAWAWSGRAGALHRAAISSAVQ